VDTVTRMPVSAGIRLGSAALQVIADDHGVDLLHIKGPAVHDSLLARTTQTDAATGQVVSRPVPRPSVDVDILVRPSHLRRWFEAMRAHGWEMAYRFQDGSAFEHASTWVREGLASADVHRTFPGIGLNPEAAFDVLWRERTQTRVAGFPCMVPSLPAQRLILILHAVRGGDLTGGDIERAWGWATPQQRDAVDSLASELGADVALAAATGRLEDHRSSREYALWRALSAGDRSRPALWWARVRAQPTVAAATRTAVWLLVPKPGRLRRALGREPTVADLVQAWIRQTRVGLREFLAVVRRRRPAGRP